MKAEEFKKQLCDNIIPFWNKMADYENGGFYGYADEYGIPDKTKDKGVILNNRILWFYSSAYLLLKDDSLLIYAKRAYDFLIDHCMDKEYGGVFWAVDYNGEPTEDIKHTYNQAFAIYALCAYYEATKDVAALHQAMSIYHIIETICKDEGGYLECFNRDFSPSDDNEKLSENGVMAQRTMNTILHVMEAYSQLYKVNPCERVKKSFFDIADILKNRIYSDQTKRLEVFFDNDYNTLIDLESYGHDIEASWLIHRAIEVVSDEKLTAQLDDIIDILAKTTYQNGLNEEKNALYNENERGVVDTKRVWWVQAEAVTGFYNIYMRNKELTEYKEVAEKIWRYIQDVVVDKESGEWIENIYDDPQKTAHQALVHQWKCPYHNGRMCIEMMQRLS